MSVWRTAGGIVVGAAAILAAGVALVALGRHHLEILGWPLVVGGAAALVVGVAWVPVRLGMPRLARFLSAEIAGRLDLGYLASLLAAEVRLPPQADVPAPASPEEIAQAVVNTLERRDALRTPELDETRQQRRIAAHGVISVLENHILDLTRTQTMLAPAFQGEWYTVREFLQRCPTFGEAVRTTDRTFQLISRLTGASFIWQANQFEEAARSARKAVEQLEEAMRLDAQLGPLRDSE